MNFIDDPVVADGNPPCLSGGKLLDSLGAWFFGKPPYDCHDSATLKAPKFGQLLLGPPSN